MVRIGAGTVKQETKYLNALRRRRDHLNRRILESHSDLSYDKSEKAALDWAISKLSFADQLDCQEQIPVSHGEEAS